MAELPQIDVTKLEYPSDKLTIKDIRVRWPEAMDTRKDDSYSLGLPKPIGQPAGELLHNMLMMERDLAKATFGIQFGNEPIISYADNNIKLLIEDLCELYIEFGIASGPHHAEQLIRSIESQAIGQAKQHMPLRP